MVSLFLIAEVASNHYALWGWIRTSTPAGAQQASGAVGWAVPFNG